MLKYETRNTPNNDAPDRRAVHCIAEDVGCQARHETQHPDAQQQRTDQDGGSLHGKEGGSGASPGADARSS